MILFVDVLDHLRQEIHRRVRNGEITQRGLARRLDMSQTHMHHVLKGVRPMRPEVADALLHAMGITLPDLLSSMQSNDVPRKGPAKEQHLPERKFAPLGKTG